MSIDTEKDLQALKRVGQVVRETLEALKHSVAVGVTTKELDRVAKDIFDKHGARSAPTLTYGFPGTVLISINDEIVHGIPSQRKIRAGDVVKLDVTPELNGYIADAAETVLVPPVSLIKQRLSDCAKAALDKAIAIVKAGVPLRRIGRTVEAEVRRQGFSVIPELAGHGVGRSIHEDPREIVNYDDRKRKGRLKDGMVITIEPIIAVGAGQRFSHTYTSADEWTIKTQDGSLAAHFEHSLVVTKGVPIVLTA